MPTAVLDPFGNTIQACSISTAVKAKFPKNSFPSEAAWAKHVKADAFNTLRAKIKAGEVPKNTVVGRTPVGQKMVYKGGDTLEITVKYGSSLEKYNVSLAQYDQTMGFHGGDWDFGPNMAKMAEQQKLIVNTPEKLTQWVKKDPEALDLDLGDTVATVKHADDGTKVGDVTFDGLDSFGNPKYKMSSDYGTELVDLDSFKWYHNSPDYSVEYKVGQVPSDLPIPHGLPVSSTSKSVGALTNEDAATMFVKTKDKLANEAGINIKGASGKLDDLVYKTIADQAGYTPAEMLAKVEAYKGSGKKLSALKKKVLPKSGNSTKFATEKSVDNAAAAVKKETPKPEDVPQVWDSEAVAKAYVKAKDHVVATNDHGWTLYTKNDQFDAEIHKWMQADLGPIKKQTADTAIADYIANHQKLSVLKKQMIKKGELVPKADTLKGTTAAKAEVGVNSPETLYEFLGTKGKVVQDGDLVALVHDAGQVKELRIVNQSYGSFVFNLDGTILNQAKLNNMHASGVNIEYKVGQVAKKTTEAKSLKLPANDAELWAQEKLAKAAPGETGAGQVGSHSLDPKKVDPKHQLTPEQEHEVFQKWETLNISVSSSGAKMLDEAKNLAKQYGLGEDVLPIMRAVDKGKTAKFGLAPEQNKMMYEKKIVEHLQNPQPNGYTAPSHTGTTAAAKSYGELPSDSGLFRDIKPEEMTELWESSMVRPNGVQQSSIRAYTGASYHDINDPLRFQPGKTVDDVRHGRNIQKSMSPLPEAILSRRGTSLRGLGMDSFEQLEAAVGKTFMEPAFSSTAVGGRGQFGGQVTLHIQSPKGTLASWFKPYSNIPGENELVLSARTHFQIMKVDVSTGPYGDKRTIVHVRVVKQEKV